MDTPAIHATLATRFPGAIGALEGSGEPAIRVRPTDIVAVATFLKTDPALAFDCLSNQSGIASETVTRAAVDACFTKTIARLGLPVTEVAYCPHPAFPVGCFCRKPLPGLGVWLMSRHRLARAEVVMVGDLGSDQGFAKALGVKYLPVEEMFGKGSADPG